MLGRLNVVIFAFLLQAGNSRVLSQNFIELTVEDGLSQGFVSSISQDRNGYIWIGTLHGLNRYDGYQIKTYHHIARDSFSLAPGEIRLITTDYSGRMWIVTSETIQYYNTEKDRFETPLISTGKKENWSKSLAIIENDQLIIAVGNSISRYRITSDKDKVVLTPVPLPGTENTDLTDMQCLYLHHSGELWLGTSSGIIGIAPDGKIRKVLPQIAANILAIWYDQIHHNVCIQAKNKVIFVDEKQQLTTFPVPEINYGQSLNGRQSGDQYLLFIGKQLMSWDGEVLTPSPVVSGRKIASGFVDRQQNIWIGFDGSGLICVKNRKTLIKRQIRKGIPARKRPVFDTDGNFWLDDTQNGVIPLYKKYTAEGSLPDPPVEMKCFFMEAGTNDNIWLSDEHYKLALVNKTGYKIFPVQANLDVSFGVNCLPDGRLLLLMSWYGFKAGFYDPEKRVLVSIPELDTLLQNFASVSSVDVSGLTDGKGWVWIAGGNELAGVRPDWEAGTGRIIRPDLKSLTEDSTNIRLIFAQSDRFDPQQLWIGTWDGLFKLDIGRQVLTRVVSYHLPVNEPVFCMAQSGPDDVWFGTLHGLVNYEQKNGKSRIYTIKDGLPAGEFNRNTAAVRNDGLIVMGTVNGYIAFYPSELIRSRQNSSLMITQVYKGTELVPVSIRNREIFLPDIPYDSASLMISFSTLDFTNQDVQQYRFRLDSNSVWLYNGYKNNVSLLSLPHGYYRLEVQSSADGSNWSESCFLQFKITPAWWNTWWARLSIALITAFAIIIIVRNRRLLVHAKHSSDLLLQKNRYERMMEENRDRLLVNIAHDLKTPITLINGLIDVWNEHPGDKIQAVMDTIRRQGADMNRLVSQITDLDRISADGTLPLEPVNIDLYKMIPSVISSYQHLAELREIVLSAGIKPGLPCIIADENGFRAILGNLLSNAIKFTPARGSIIFNVDADEAQLYFTVSDSGPGVAREEKEKIFERYYQSQFAKEIGGSGIGLSYAAEMAGLLGGRLQLIESDDKFLRGATFRFSLPLPNVAAVSSSGQTDITDDNSQISRNRPIVLVVEDHPEMGEYIRQMLMSDYQVVLASDGNSGLDKAIRLIPDLIVSDVMMPGLTGTDLCGLLRADIRTSHIPVILLTAKTDTNSVRTGLEKGANLYLAKPFDREQLRYYVRNSLNLARQLRDYYRSAWMDSGVRTSPPPEGLVSVQEAEFIRNVNDIIRDNFADSLFNVEKLAMLLCVSKAQLHRKIGALGGESAGNMIRYYRITKAASLLLEQHHLTVSEIAFACGFPDANYFSTAFSKEYGMSPSAFRKMRQT